MLFPLFSCENFRIKQKLKMNKILLFMTKMNIFTFIFIAMICTFHRNKHHINAGPLDAEKSKLNHDETRTETSEADGHKHSLPAADHGDNYYDHEVGGDDIKMNEMKMQQENSINKEQEQIVHPKSHDGVCKIDEDAKFNFNDDIFGPHISGEDEHRPAVAKPMPMST